jgi:hypothetical protein
MVEKLGKFYVEIASRKSKCRMCNNPIMKDEKHLIAYHGHFETTSPIRIHLHHFKEDELMVELL